MENVRELKNLLSEVRKLVREAGEIACRGKKEKIKDKPLQGPVSETDLEVENFLHNVLTSLIPDSGFYGEERGKGEEKKWMWVVDPIDGTMNYIHEIPHFSISVALTHNGETVLGVVYDPNRKEMFSASLGGGAHLNNFPIKPSSCSSLKDAIIGTGFSKVPDWRKRNLDIFTLLLNKAGSLRRLGSAALDLAYVACGRLDCFWEIGLNPWDISAGVLLVREAGGKVTDLSGEENFEEKREILASNSLLHGIVLKEIQKSLSLS
ncbi:inositol monophosphatase [Candidatus Calescamantes bacterium]|nr:inositol monophosphatase [Candidatus Calescamantes bacterium]